VSTIVDRLIEMTYCYFYHIFSTGEKIINFISASKELKTDGHHDHGTYGASKASGD